jgi:hypothetical protein
MCGGGTCTGCGHSLCPSHLGKVNLAPASGDGRLGLYLLCALVLRAMLVNDGRSLDLVLLVLFSSHNFSDS